MLIKLTCPTGSVEVETDDPYYRAFFSDLEEATGTLPSSLEVPKEVIEQFPAWERLKKWIAIGPSALLDYSPRHIPSLRTSSQLPCVFLADVRVLLGYLVELPTTALIYLAVDRRSPPHERRDHYRTVGRYVRQLRTNIIGRQETVYYKSDRLYADFYLENDPITFVQTGKILDEKTPAHLILEEVEQRAVDALAIDWLNIARGIRQSVVVQQSARGDRYTFSFGFFTRVSEADDWSLIIWEDVLNYMPVDWYALRGKKTDTYESAMEAHRTLPQHAPLEAYSLAGMRLPSLPSLSESCQVDRHSTPPPGTFVFTPPLGGPLSLSLSNVALFYDRLLDSLTLETGESMLPSVHFGLGVILSRGTDTKINRETGREVIPEALGTVPTYGCNMWSLIAVIHTYTLLEARRGEGKVNVEMLPPSHFEDAVSYVGSHLGTRSLSVMVATLLVYNATDKKALLFCEKALSYIESSGALTGFSHM